MPGATLRGCGASRRAAEGRDHYQGLPGRRIGRAVMGLSRAGASAIGAGLGILLVAERFPPDRQGRDPVQLVPVPGELDRPGTFRMDPFELESAAEGYDRSVL